MVDNETRLAERAVNGRNEPIDSSRCQAEEVEIASVSPNIAANDQRSSACEREVGRFLSAASLRAWSGRARRRPHRYEH